MFCVLLVWTTWLTEDSVLRNQGLVKLTHDPLYKGRTYEEILVTLTKPLHRSLTNILKIHTRNRI